MTSRFTGRRLYPFFHSREEFGTTVETIDAEYDTELFTSSQIRLCSNIDSVYNGSLEIDGAYFTKVGFSQISDERMKSNITPMMPSDSQYLYNISPKLFVYKENPDVVVSGFIAQEIQLENERLITKNSDGYLCVDYVKMIPDIVNELQVLRSQVFFFSSLWTKFKTTLMRLFN